MSLKLKGVAQMRAKLRKIAQQYPGRVEAALYREAQIEMTESKRRCPVSPTAAQFKAMGRKMPKGTVPGTLRATGTVHEPERIGNLISVTLSYGGGAVQYAAVQHERLDFFHTTGQARYLASVLEESRPYIAARVARRIKL
ncbi:MAG: hypothetical protein NUV51_09300 [Sulfuricaulis sp.]|nr:hypothetical protein [Sulfuricaulis sp.]